MAKMTKKQFIEKMEQGIEELRNGGHFFIDLQAGYLFGNRNYGEVSVPMAAESNLTVNLFNSSEEEQNNPVLPGGKLVYGKAVENLVEITLVYAELVKTHEYLSSIDSTRWKQYFTDWANEFEDQHGTIDWNSGEHGDYYEEIEKFAKKKILAVIGMEE